MMPYSSAFPMCKMCFFPAFLGAAETVELLEYDALPTACKMCFFWPFLERVSNQVTVLSRIKKRINKINHYSLNNDLTSHQMKSQKQNSSRSAVLQDLKFLC